MELQKMVEKIIGKSPPDAYVVPVDGAGEPTTPDKAVECQAWPLGSFTSDGRLVTEVAYGRVEDYLARA